jgi:multidrug efflux system membrane fusion protein
MRRSLIVGLCVVAVAAAYPVWRQFAPSAASAPERPAGTGGPAGPGAGGEKRPVPVVTAKAARKPVPVYLDGLGTVQAYNTVTVHSRIDGELVEVAFTEGQEVKAGDVLARLDARTTQAQLDQALAAKAKDEAQLELARLDLQRYLGLGNRIPGQTVDTQRATVKQLEAAVRVDQAMIDSARTLLSYTVITSPIPGRTGLRLVDRGNIVRASDAGGLVVVAQLQPITVVFTLPQQNLAAIMDELHRQGKLPVTISDSTGGTQLEQGELTLVDNQIDPTTGTIRLKAVAANAQRRLWPGAFVAVRLLLTTRHDGVVVPAPAILRGPQGAYVFRVTPDRTVEMRPVTVALVENDEALVETGLSEGDAVVVDGVGKLQPGTRVAEAGRGSKP